MEDVIHQVVTKRVQPMQPIIEAEGENTEGSVGFVRLLFVHRDAPEIILEYILQRT